MTRTSYTLLLAVLLLAPTTARAAADPAETTKSRHVVLPATARPHGVSLTEMAEKVALFQSSVNAGTPIELPDTSFQILYTNNDNHFSVEPGTFLYVPVFNIDDSPPVVGCASPGIAGTTGCTGIFPADHRSALAYVFSPKQMGGQKMAITVDGSSVPLGQDYLAGPVHTPPLLDATPHNLPGGTDMLFIAAFLRPLAVGTHSVTISGEFDGPFIQTTLGVNSIKENTSYTVNVTTDR